MLASEASVVSAWEVRVHGLCQSRLRADRTSLSSVVNPVASATITGRYLDTVIFNLPLAISTFTFERLPI